MHFVILALSARAADTAAVDTLAEDLARQVLPEVRGDAVATLVRAEGVTPDWFHVAAFEGLLLSKLSTRSFMSVTVVADRDKLVNAADSAARRSELAVRSGALWLLYVELHPYDERVDADAELYRLGADGEKRTYRAAYRRTKGGQPAVPPPGRTGDAVVVTNGEELDFAALAREVQVKEQEAAKAREADARMALQAREAAERAAAAEKRRAQDAAREVAERDAAAKKLKDEMERRLTAERRQKLDAAAANLRAEATRDYQAISRLVTSPTREGRTVLDAWLARYGNAKVSVDGVSEPVVVAEVGKVRAALAMGRAVANADYDSPALGRMKWIPAGTFVMGSPYDEAGRAAEEVPHEVLLSEGYWLMEHEVTQGEWKSLMASNPAQFKACGDACPVEQVSWDDAAAFARAASVRDGVPYRLPTEAEWENAARGDDNYEYAGASESDAVAWTAENSGRTPHEVCQKRRNGFGLCDMSGNVFEFVQDWYGEMRDKSAIDPAGAGSGAFRIDRGGSWNMSEQYARVAYRGDMSPAYARNAYVGFRLARSAP